jgi:hypothetical protein
VTNYFRAVRIIPRDAPRVGFYFTSHERVSEAILRALQELPFSSVRQLTHATHLRVTTVYRRLSAKLRFTQRHLRWVPHVPSDDQKATRVQYSRSFLTRLRGQ